MQIVVRMAMAPLPVLLPVAIANPIELSIPAVVLVRPHTVCAGLALVPLMLVAIPLVAVLASVSMVVSIMIIRT